MEIYSIICVGIIKLFSPDSATETWLVCRLVLLDDPVPEQANIQDNSVMVIPLWLHLSVQTKIYEAAALFPRVTCWALRYTRYDHMNNISLWLEKQQKSGWRKHFSGFFSLLRMQKHDITTKSSRYADDTLRKSQRKRLSDQWQHGNSSLW